MPNARSKSLFPRLRRNPGGPEFATAWAIFRTIPELGGDTPRESAPAQLAAQT